MIPIKLVEGRARPDGGGLRTTGEVARFALALLDVAELLEELHGRQATFLRMGE
jgi:hypothetical protein